MIGWQPNPFIFVHIPKCAGTSIEKALMPIATSKDDFKQLTPLERSRFWLPGQQALQHSMLWQYEEHFQLSKYFKFSFVRNPWDRAISQINYLKRNARLECFLNKSFKEQVRIYCKLKLTVWGQDLGASQVDYLRDKSNRIDIDYIGRFETLPSDFTAICRRTGIDPVPGLPHIINSSRKLHYSHFYDAESAEWIRQRFSRDIDCFCYAFEDRKQNVETTNGPSAEVM